MLSFLSLYFGHGCEVSSLGGSWTDYASAVLASLSPFLSGL